MNELQAALNRILSALAAIEQSGEPLSDDMAIAATEAIQGINQRIRELQQQPEPNAPIPSGVELAWILAGGDPQAFTQYLRTIPDPALNQLARNPAQLNQTIQELSRRITVPHGEVADGIPKADLQSSNVYGFNYNPRTGSMFVKFNGKDSQGDGPIYEYQGVPPQIFKMVKSGAIPAKTTGSNRFGSWWRGKNPSLGASVHELIKSGGFPYQRVA